MRRGKRPARRQAFHCDVSRRGPFHQKVECINNTNIADAIATNHGITKADAKKLVDAVFGAIADAAAKGKEVSLNGFGKFKVKDTPERQGRNPATGEAITISASKKLGFISRVNTYISSHAAALHLAHRAEGQAGVRKTLRLQTRYETKAFHRNHWRPALLRALLAHEAFTEGAFAEVLPIQNDMLEDLEGEPGE